MNDMTISMEIALRPLHVLLVEDTPDDAVLLARALRRSGFAVKYERVETEAQMRTALEKGGWDIVISDYSMPEFSALEALRLTKMFDPQLPFIIVSGNIGEDVAVDAMRAGAQDYLIKNNLARLGPAVMRELEESANRRRQLAAEEALAASEARLHSILDSLGDIVWSISLPSLRLDYLNPAAEHIYGRPVGYFTGHLGHWLETVHPDDRERMRGYTRDVLEKGSHSAEYRIVRPDGEVRWLFDRARVITNERGRRLRIDGIAADITERKRQEELLYRFSHYDALTGLPNRSLMLAQLAQALAHAQRGGHMVAVLLVDLDRFKTINDGLGHSMGDEVLREIARRIAGAVRGNDLVARLGGDEFALVLNDIDNEHVVATLTQKLIYAIEPSLRLAGQEIYCTTSIGIALYPRDGATPEELLKNADTAMYEAKRAGRDTLRFYSAEMNTFAANQLELEAALRGALERKELEVHYQPQVDLTRNGNVCAFEALARWRHPERGMVPPTVFIPLAEETGLIGPIGDFVLRESCRQAKRWVENFDANIKIAVNLSARQFNQPDLPQRIAQVLRETGLPARNLELTESLVMKDVARSTAMLKELKAMGVALAIDDFGTGYSSLAYLKRFPIDQVKIDKSFVADISSKPEDASICSSIIALAHSLRLRVVAEGVEETGQLGFLLQHQCDRMQGFVFDRPLPAAEVDELLRSQRRLDLTALDINRPQRTLLLVDDEENILTALKRLLRRDGYTIISTTDPTKAFELLAQHQVGVVVSDQRMPQMSGTELLREVKSLYPDTIRIVLSGYTDLKSVTDAINEGAIYRFLTKPWEDDQLREAIREAFHQQEMAAENLRLSRENREANGKLAEANEMLRALLVEKASRIARDETMIGVAQEAFHHVPLPIIGVDDGGMIVLATGAAKRAFPRALPGNTLDECFPPHWLQHLRDPHGAIPGRLELDGIAYRPVRERLSVPGGGAGWLLTLLPAEHPLGAAASAEEGNP
ncbi:MAG: EAL domain-containing protein [Pseudomonadota bacterium]